MNRLRLLRPDPFTLGLVAMVALAAVLPLRDGVAHAFDTATSGAIALLFFLHGARLSRDAVIAGAAHWRLHLTVLAFTYVVFPLLGLAITALPETVIPSGLGLGILFLCCLPSTVQSSIAFTSIAGGNIPAAICSASASNLIGVFLTPVLVGVLMSAGGGAVSLDSIQAIVLQLLVPFMAGQLLRPWIGGWVQRHKKILGLVDRGSILMVVYGAFSEAVVAGLWTQVSPSWLAAMIVVNVLLLALVLGLTAGVSRVLGFSRPDQIAIVFCGSKKSLASGVPIANVLFAGPSVGMIVLPLMLFHQIQLMVCAVLARRYAAQTASRGDDGGY